MNPITLARFDALAGYCRFGPGMAIAEECGWYESADGSLLGLIVRDRQDGDYQGILLARDRADRFRWVNGTSFFEEPETALIELRAQAPRVAEKIEHQRGQVDEASAAMDFFFLRVPQARLHPSFTALSETEGYSPARELISSMMRWHEDIDGNYVEQFQSTAFDARLLELYVFGLLIENGFSLDHTHFAPDYLANDGIAEIAIEVTTCNPSLDGRGQVVPPPQPRTAAEQLDYLKEYIPIKFGSALTSKLAKRYWELPHVAGKPLAFAIQDFHKPGSMMYARSGLSIYLYGYDYDSHHNEQGELVILPRKIAEHRWLEKVIPSGFFDLPGAEYVSAVLFNNTATLSKFNRMGFVARMGSADVRMFVEGMALSPDPNAAEPIPFAIAVDGEYEETWSEGLEVYHNPRALHPLDPRHFPSAVHHHLADDAMLRTMWNGSFHPLGSFTQIFTFQDNQPAAE
ncbi:hypothetical protein [Stenotrophomonas rhizophila]|uniref:hypothetical protein n=1 Tax=Stenotrophomonas rhizophila TaxID=216778 RepID=UPI0011A54ACA|nr:hypothetical protein [Stenotrophomonas rhizophila]